jgi:hypothetical protein
MSLPTVDAEWLRRLADLVEQGVVDVIKCELREGGVVLGVVKPRSPQERHVED